MESLPICLQRNILTYIEYPITNIQKIFNNKLNRKWGTICPYCKPTDNKCSAIACGYLFGKKNIEFKCANYKKSVNTVISWRLMYDRNNEPYAYYKQRYKYNKNGKLIKSSRKTHTCSNKSGPR